MILDKYPQITFVSSKTSDGNMLFSKGEASEVLANREKFLKPLGISLDSLVVMELEHDVHILKVGKENLGRGAFNPNNLLPADCLMTNQPGVYLMMGIAD